MLLLIENHQSTSIRYNNTFQNRQKIFIKKNKKKKIFNDCAIFFVDYRTIVININW